MRLLLTAAFAAALFCTVARADDAPTDCDGCRDHALLARYPGSTLVGASQVAFDEATFPIGASSRDADTDEAIKPKTQTYAGKRTRLYYLLPTGRSVLEVFANYRQAVDKAGMTVEWTCAGDDCGRGFEQHAVDALDVDLSNSLDARIGFSDAEKPRYLVARLQRPEGTVHVAVLAAELSTRDRGGLYVVVLEEKPMDQGLVTLDAGALARDLAAQGKVAVYGIRFDFDQARIKPESKPQLDAIAQLLRAQPTLKLRITGHTDNQGQDAYNLDLSQRRAQAIVAALRGDYGIAPDRLAAAGLGASAPVAGNDTDAGRALNRRVELAPQ